jgi:MEMO1 family protein
MPHANPKLRPVQTYFVEHRGRPAIMLRDPLQLGPNVMAVPQELGPLMALCDGTRDFNALRAALVVQAGINLSPQTLQQILDQFDENLLLDNERFAQARTQALERYRALSHREPASAGVSYPPDPAELRVLLDGFMESARSKALQSDSPTDRLRGLVCPHIDYARGGEVYAQVWNATANAARQARRVIVLGTDHMGGDGQVTLTRQNYATPWGSFPTDQDLVSAIADAIGDEAAFAEELNHIGEHSIELALVWLHYVRDGRACDLVPILCGGFRAFVSGEVEPAIHSPFTGTMSALKEAVHTPGTLVIAAADLAHVGPAFGDLLPFDFLARMRLQMADDRLVDCISRGSAQELFAQVKSVQDKNRVCGLPPVYLALRLLENSTGHRLGYMQCPADEQAASWVSVCGVALT